MPMRAALLTGERMTTLSCPPSRLHFLDRRADQIASLAINADPDALIDTKQMSAWLGVSIPWLEIGRSKNYGPPYRKIGAKIVRYRVGDVVAWLDERKRVAEKKSSEAA